MSKKLLAVLFLGIVIFFGFQAAAYGTQAGAKKAASPSRVGVLFVFEQFGKGERFLIEATNNTTSASFTASSNEGSRAYYCCLPYPSEAKVWRMYPDGSKYLVLKFPITKQAAMTLNFTITLDKDDNVSLLVEKKK